ncbi:MAG TPA: acyclic terpene utilization AtuA family protein [Burkholderiaceae bacterium]|nr:acyclic terpene utilization AtuA family protein [Burkholderiaceae bacterium]
MRANAPRTRSLRIGAGASYAGDRIEPATDLAARGQLDYLVYECLAERTIALAQLERLKDPSKGYNELLDERFRRALPHCRRNGTRVITSMGAANPVGAARHTAAIVQELGLAPMKVAAVIGDDVLEYCLQHQDALQVMETGEPLAALAGEIVSANAYLGAEPLVEALRRSADVVLTGRVADCSLFLAAMIHEFGWAFDDWERLGRGQAAGDMVECGAIVSGGYYADPGYKEVDDLANLGFPYLVVQPDGSSEVTKLEGTGGVINRAICTEHLIYEIHDLANYVTPDVVVDFSDVRLEELGKDRVRISGVRGKARPAQLKVSIGVREGWIGEGEITYAGLGCLNRARLAEQVVRERLRISGVQLQELRVDYIGLNSLHGEASIPPKEPPYEVRLRFAGRAKSRRDAVRLGNEVETLVGKGPCSSSLPRQYVREVLAIYSCLVPRSAVHPEVVFVEADR